MTDNRIVWALAAASAVWAGDAATAQRLVPLTDTAVGRIVEASGPVGSVRIRRNGRFYDVGAGQTLQNGDEVFVEDGSNAYVAFTRTAGASIPAAGNPYWVRRGSLWPSLGEALAYLFVRPSSGALASTPKGAGEGRKPEYSPLLPAAEQAIGASGPQAIPVVWRGSASSVRLFDVSGREIAGARPDKAGFALVQAPALAVGQFELVVGGRLDGIVIPVRVTEPAAATRSPFEVLAKGPEELRLEALIELQKGSDQDYQADEVLRALEQGGG